MVTAKKAEPRERGIETTDLPPGKTCADCYHVHRCVLFGFTRLENTRCDFAPSRFVGLWDKAEVRGLAPKRKAGK